MNNYIALRLRDTHEWDHKKMWGTATAAAVVWLTMGLLLRDQKTETCKNSTQYNLYGTF